MAESYPVLFEKALAQWLDDQNLGLYKPTGSYTAAEATLTAPGITTNGPDLPTTFDNCLVLTSLDPIVDGRANFVWRIQIVGRLKGTKTQAKDLLWNLRVALEHKQNIPPGFFISWVSVFSSLMFTADSSGRHSFSLTVYFRGRRPI